MYALSIRPVYLQELAITCSVSLDRDKLQHPVQYIVRQTRVLGEEKSPNHPAGIGTLEPNFQLQPMFALQANTVFC